MYDLFTHCSNNYENKNHNTNDSHSSNQWGGVGAKQ